MGGCIAPEQKTKGAGEAGRDEINADVSCEGAVQA